MKKQDRRKFLLAGMSLAAFAAFRLEKKSEEKKTVRLLTQDGKLVEIDADKLPSATRTASGSDVQNWIKNKNA
jgi:DNA gyrase/topoisomerase IV subunit A